VRQKVYGRLVSAITRRSISFGSKVPWDARLITFLATTWSNGVVGIFQLQGCSYPLECGRHILYRFRPECCARHIFSNRHKIPLERFTPKSPVEESTPNWNSQPCSPVPQWNQGAEQGLYSPQMNVCSVRLLFAHGRTTGSAAIWVVSGRRISGHPGA
jgi:hypothetical protein